jgi:hypothetical protein
VNDPGRKVARKIARAAWSINQSFDEVVSAMSNGGLLVALDHPNTDKCPNQRMFVVRILGC